MLVWVIYAQTSVTARLQVVFTATSHRTSRHCFWWLHLRDLPNCVSVFPKVGPRVSAQGLFTSKRFCDSLKKHKSHEFPFFLLFPFFFYEEHPVWNINNFFLLLFSLSLSPVLAASKQSLVPINLWSHWGTYKRVVKYLKRAHTDIHTCPGEQYGNSRPSCFPLLSPGALAVCFA